MKIEDIKSGCIYFVNYDPVRSGEFGKGKHLSVIIRTFTDMCLSIPMTSKCSGIKGHQVDLGYLGCLPPRLQQKKSYAIVQQTRAISPTRVEAIIDRGEPVVVELPEGRKKKLKCALADTYRFD